MEGPLLLDAMPAVDLYAMLGRIEFIDGQHFAGEFVHGEKIHIIEIHRHMQEHLCARPREHLQDGLRGGIEIDIDRDKTDGIFDARQVT